MSRRLHAVVRDAFPPTKNDSGDTATYDRSRVRVRRGERSLAVDFGRQPEGGLGKRDRSIVRLGGLDEPVGWRRSPLRQRARGSLVPGALHGHPYLPSDLTEAEPPR